jgi:hypothetical protein
MIVNNDVDAARRDASMRKFLWTSCLTGKSLFSVKPVVRKYSASAVGQITGRSSPHPVPRRGALAIVTNVGMGCGGRGSVRRETESQGGFPVSDHRHADDGAKARLSLLAKTGGCVRQNRVVLAPVAGVKSAEVFQTQPGLAKSSIRRRR